MKRRAFTQALSLLTVGSVSIPLNLAAMPVYNNEEAPNLDLLALPAKLPENIRRMAGRILDTPYQDINTDWFGSIQIEGLLRFAARGEVKNLDYAFKWFEYHVQHDRTLTDEQYYKQYEGNRARILRDGPLTFAIYSANLGVAFPVHELYKQRKDARARQVCLDVANAILHYAARDRFGMLAHDDFNFTDFAIPDTAYWATRANAIAASLSPDPGVAGVYWKQSIYQMEQGIKYFLDRDKGLVRTGLFKGEPGKTYWCRSQGWLLWAMAGLLRYLPRDHSKFKTIAADMKLIANGLSAVLTTNGALRVLVDDPSTPEEMTGTCMVLSALKEAVRKGWIPDQHQQMLNKMWDYVQKSVKADGQIQNVYTGWAVNAEQHKTDLMDKRFMGYVPGIVLLAADEMTR
jgi:rhamnogalacturonyl hydrolase YesR